MATMMAARCNRCLCWAVVLATIVDQAAALSHGYLGYTVQISRGYLGHTVPINRAGGEAACTNSCLKPKILFAHVKPTHCLDHGYLLQRTIPSTGRPGRHPSVQLLARKPFKGGRLDDFLKAGEAEAKFGPTRYASVAEDAWKIQVEQTQTEAQRQATIEAYKMQKIQLLSDHALLSAIGTAGFWAFSSVAETGSYAFGAFMGAFYLVLKQREADSFGATSVEEVRGGPPALAAPVLMVLIYGKNKAVLAFIPVLAGFLTNLLATVAQAAYPTYTESE